MCSAYRGAKTGSFTPFPVFQEAQQGTQLNPPPLLGPPQKRPRRDRSTEKLRWPLFRASSRVRGDRLERRGPRLQDHRQRRGGLGAPGAPAGGSARGAAFLVRVMGGGRGKKVCGVRQRKRQVFGLSPFVLFNDVFIL